MEDERARETDTQTDRKTDKKTDMRKTERERERERERETETERQGETERYRDRKRERERERERERDKLIDRLNEFYKPSSILMVTAWLLSLCTLRHVFSASMYSILETDLTIIKGRISGQEIVQLLFSNIIFMLRDTDRISMEKKGIETLKHTFK